MKIWRDKEGKWLTPKEFSERFKKGVEGITPIQQTKSTIVFTWITLIGILAGFCLALALFSKFWWGAIILFAAGGNTAVSLIGLYQKYKREKEIQDRLNLMEKEVTNNGS